MRGCAIPALLTTLCLVLAPGGAPTARAGKKQSASLPAGGRTVGGPGSLEVPEGATTVLWRTQPGVEYDVCLTVTVEKGRPLQIRLLNDSKAVLRQIGLDPGQSRGICDENVGFIEFECPSPVVPGKRPLDCRASWRVDLIDAERLLTVQAEIPGPGSATRSVVGNSTLGVTCQVDGTCWSGSVSEDASVLLDAAPFACFDAPCFSRADFVRWDGCDATSQGSGADTACTVKMNADRTVSAVYQ